MISYVQSTHTDKSLILVFGPLLLGIIFTLLLIPQTGNLSQPVSLMILIVSAVKLFPSKSEPVQNTDLSMALLLSLIFIIPSQQLNWLICLSMTLWLSVKHSWSDHSQQLINLIAVTAFINLVVTYALKFFAASILAVDASLISWFLEQIDGPSHRIGNVVFSQADHQLLILRGCSSLVLIADAILAWYALSVFSGNSRPVRQWPWWMALTALLLLLNQVRLLMMGLDLDWHQWWHTETGMQAFQGMSVGLILMIHFIRGLHENA